MAEFNFLELAREDGYTASSSAEDGASKCTFQLKGEDDDTPPEVEQLTSFSRFLCGGVDNIDPKVTQPTDGDAGKIRRQMPKTHPWDPELSAAGVGRIQGFGGQSEADAVAIQGLESVTEQFTHFTHYHYETEFKRRPYFLMSDEYVARNKIKYYKPDGTDTDVYYAAEWNRFFVKTTEPLPDTVNATTAGQMKFRTSGGGLDGVQFPGQTWVYLHNQRLIAQWYMVPYRYFFAFTEGGVTYQPYLSRYLNTVNQNDILGFLAGQLLFKGATPTPFMPQVADIVDYLDEGLFQSDAMLCNVRMEWLVTTRETDDPPAAGTKGLPNLNNIPAGHNLQPSFTDRKFHYVTVEDPGAPADETKWRASFPSFPHELLFTDPLLAQPGGPL